MNKKIIIKGARENNLKNIDLEIPKESLVVFTGLSGSGKTTLAFDTIFAEGQRKYMESMSSYARQFLGNYDKPDVDSIDGLSPSIAIDQKSVSHNPRSTVGTVTEIYDYLRLLYGRIGVPFCPEHHIPIVSFSVSMMTDQVFAYPEGTKIQLLSPVVHHEKGTHKEVLDKIRQNGFTRLRVDGVMTTVEEVVELDKNKKHDIDIVIDRIIVKSDVRSRVFESIETALDWSHGLLIILSDFEEKILSDRHTCPICGFSIPKLEPRLFSFNSPLGCCPDCKGLGIKREADARLLVPRPELSINGGAIEYYKHMVGSQNLEWQEFTLLCKLYDIPMNIPFKDLTKKSQDIIFFGSPDVHKYVLKSSSGNLNNRIGYIEGVKIKIERLYRETSSDWMREYYEKFLHDTECTTCHGSRLNKEALAVLIDERNIDQVSRLQIKELRDWIVQLPNKLTRNQNDIARLVLREIENRTTFLCDVGLEYLTLSRMAMTLSGGESQRIRLATQIGSKLTGILYVLDEPSIGLHQRDSEKLIKSLREMRDLGNTLIVVEHDEEMVRSADYIVDIGPGAGIHGGRVVATGKVEDIEKCPESITGQYLSHKKFIPIPHKRKPGNGKYISIKGATCHNLKNINVDFPLGTFTVVTGVSGSGKSSLVNQTLFTHLKNYLSNGDGIQETGPVKSISGFEYIDKIVDVSQEPIGRTPRSNPATYVKLFDSIRELFSETVEAKAHGFDKGRFSFNVIGGRCEECQGAGIVRIPMNFLPDVYVKCDSCGGKRYNEETLQVTYKGKNIFDVLEMTVEDALDFFANRPSLKKKIETLFDVGLNYIKLGQPATTLSGGEAQRIKLAAELQKRPTGKTVYILDEPTTGLHADDVGRLLKILQRLVNHGDTVIVIEHNLDIIKAADYIIDLGPNGGDGGGQVVATGTPEEVSENPKSFTGQYLKQVLKKGPRD
ncbi:MAG TPA: excinuclease ABC subunit UvrA [Bacilli bacterium]|nr:excinuclease ABC subunit UvrA [Bacilli bacterium]HQA56224.1 excinuclease ABC subunit UvrA [Bacilli bacterium]